MNAAAWKDGCVSNVKCHWEWPTCSKNYVFHNTLENTTKNVMSRVRAYLLLQTFRGEGSTGIHLHYLHRHTLSRVPMDRQLHPTKVHSFNVKPRGELAICLTLRMLLRPMSVQIPILPRIAIFRPLPAKTAFPRPYSTLENVICFDI